MHFIPIVAAGLLPHRPPMLLVDELVAVCGETGICRALVRSDCLFVTKGELDPVALIELIAQTFAAVSSYRNHGKKNMPNKGFLVAVKSMRVMNRIQVGDILNIAVERVATVGEFSVVQGIISRQGRQVATGRLSVWIPPLDGVE